jgi:RimJ/RimL family protein N-acetyltransferase
MDKSAPGDVQLRSVREDDLPIFFAQQAEPEANAMAAFSARDWDTFIAHWHKILREATGVNRTILFNGEVAGNIASFEVGGEQAVGYWIGKKYWGKGIATRALAALLADIKQRPLYAHVAKHNIASRKVLEKCGFTLFAEDNDVSDEHGEAVAEFILILTS